MSKKKQKKIKQNVKPAASNITAGAAVHALYPQHDTVEPRETSLVDLPSGALGAHAFTSNPFQMGPMSVCGEELSVLTRLPLDREAKYGIYTVMAEDPTINLAIKTHIGHALSCKTDTGRAVTIEPVNENDNPIVQDLKALLEDTINANANEWAYNAAVYGTHFLRVYGKLGEGLRNIRSDFYTHARHVKKFEKAGKVVGYTSAYQGTSPYADRVIRLLPPWTFVECQIQTWSASEVLEPINYSGIPVDLSIENYEAESIIESQSYGASLLEAAYRPWLDLCEAILSMNMSRKNAARLERIVGVGTGRLDPERAARFMDMLAAQMLHTDREMARQSWAKGNVQTVINRMVPIFGDKGRLDINTVQGTPDINGLEDVMFHVKRLGGALGVDPAMLGFGDFLAGSLGDGGYERVSLFAGMHSQALRNAILQCIERLCDLHVAWKYNKVFLPGEKPWKICFNAISTAIEREEQENIETRANQAGTLAGILATVDQEFQITDRRAFMQHVWCDIMKKTNDTFETVFPPNMPSAENAIADEEDERI